MLLALTLTVIYLSAIVVQLVVDFNILAPVEIAVGIGIMLKSAFVQPREEGWNRKVIGLLLTIVFFYYIIIIEQRSPESPIGVTPLALNLLTLLAFFLLLMQTGTLIRHKTANQWQEKLKRATFGCVFTLIAAGTFYNPYNPDFVIPIAGLLGHVLLGLVYFYSFAAIEEYSLQHVLLLDSDEWLYRLEQSEKSEQSE